MGERIRTHDWSTTPLGPFETWPSALHTAAGIVLGARAAMAIGWGPKFTLLYNGAWTALIGDRHPRALGQPARAVFPGIWETVGPLLAGVMAGQGAVERHDQRLMVNRRGGDVEEAWFDYSFSPIPCADGTIGGVFCVAAETTDHVRAEQALRQEGERLRLAASAAHIGTYTRDLRTGEDNWSPGFLALFGLGPHDSLSLKDDIPAAVHPDDHERVVAETVGRRQGSVEPDFSSEHRIVLPSGEVRRVLLRGQVDFDEQGQAVKVIGVAMDITGRVRAEEALRRERSLLDSVMRTTDVMLVLLDRQFNFVWVNPAYAETCGMKPEEMVGRNHFALYPDEENEAVFRQVRDTGEGVFYRDKPFVFPDQPERGVTYWDWSLAPLKGSGGDVTGLVFSLRETTKYVQANEALRESKERAQWLARFPEENPSPVLRVSADGTVLYCNAAAAEALDWRCQVSHSLSHDNLRCLVDQALADGRAIERDVELHGTTFRVAAAPVAGEGYVNVYGIDITERKRAEEALRQYAERLRFLREVVEAILAARSAQEVAQAVVERVPRLLPCLRVSVLMRDQETGEMLMLAVYHRGESKLRAGQRGVLGAAESSVLERLARGETYVLDDLQASPFSAPVVAQLKAEGVRAQVFESIQIEGQLVGLLVVSMDVPGPVPADQQDVLHDLALQLAVGLEQVRLYEAVQHYAGELEQLVQQRTAALEVSEARFRTIFEEAAIGIALADAEGVLMATNPALRRMLGYDKGELVGRCMFDLLSAEGRCDELPEELLAGQRGEYTLEQGYVRKDGEIGQANVTLSLLHRDTDQAPLVLVLTEDITERVQAQAALIRAEKLAILGRMTTSLAHEINNPIQSVVGCLGLAMEVLHEGEDATRFMEVALEESERAARIVRRLRDLTRSEEILREPSDVRELVDTVLVLTQNQAQNAQVALIWEGEDDLPEVPVVRDRIQQVFLNLVLNAIDAMPEGGELRVRAVPTDAPDGVSISFTDTGVGIPPEQIERLFEAFHSTKEMGLGLGLHVSRNIVGEHGGHINVESEPGHGTTFTVWLPRS